MQAFMFISFILYCKHIWNTTTSTKKVLPKENPTPI